MLQLDSSASLTSSPYLWVLLALATTILFRTLFVGPSSLNKSGASHTKALHSGIGPVSFYSTRNAFLRSVFGAPETFAQSPPSVRAHRLNARDNVITVTNNVADARAFFFDRSLDLNSAYEVLFAGIPKMLEWMKLTKGADDAGAVNFSTTIKGALSYKRLNAGMPEMVKHSLESFQTLPKKDGRIDVHETIYPLIFRLSIQLIGLREHVTSLEMVKRLEKPFWQFANNIGYMATHFPLVPVPSTVAKWTDAITMSTEISKTIAKRKADGRREDDYIQELIDQGKSDRAIEDFIMGGLFAAIINTTGMTAYLLIFICANPEIRKKVTYELVSVLKKHAEKRGDDYNSLSIQEKLGRIPLEVWEDELPYYELVNKETVRRLMVSTLFRRKLKSKETIISGVKVQEDEFISYWLSGSHLNSEIYSNPLKFDPERFKRGEGSKEGDFVGWGIGNHSCLGMRFAKLEMKAAHAAFLLSFPDAKSVDQNGTPYTSENVPGPQKESEHRRYPEKPVFLAYGQNLSL